MEGDFPMTGMMWGRWSLDFERRSTLVMGILNVTPDSFSDGGLYRDTARAVDRALEMEAEGADVVDIGGESTRPGSRPVPRDEELQRIVPVIEAIAEKIRVPVSVDTYKSSTAREALQAGASMINCVGAFSMDDAMPEVAAEAGVPVVLMHMQGTPVTMQVNPTYGDVVGEIRAELESAVARALRAGIRKNLLIVDPGLGFGKSLEHNLTILRHISSFRSLGCPVLIGPSRKSFIARAVTGKGTVRASSDCGHGWSHDAARAVGEGSAERAAMDGLSAERQGKARTAFPFLAEREDGTSAVVAWAWSQGVRFVRVHDVGRAVNVLKMLEAVTGMGTVRASTDRGHGGSHNAARAVTGMVGS